MSQKDDSESDIWEYKPLEKKKKKHESPTVTKRRCTVKKTSKRDTSVPVESPDLRVKTPGFGDFESRDSPSQSSSARDPVQTDHAAEGPSSGHFCPMCQMPFSILGVQTQRWHVSECLDTPRDTCTECPNGLQCFSSISNHYKKFNHTLLAHSRANSDTALLSLSQQAATSGKTVFSRLPGIINNELDGSRLENSQDSVLSLFALSNRNVTPDHIGTPPSKLTNGLLLLRSPGPEDFKKKKGWSSSAKSQTSISSSQESRTELSSTPVNAQSGRQAREDLLKRGSSSDNNNTISYSPLSEFPAQTAVNRGECRKALFNNDTLHNADEDSMVLFSDDFSSEDELLTDFINNFETNNVQVKEPASLNTRLDSVPSSPPANPSAAESRVDFQGEKEARDKSTGAISSIQSPQSIVLERLRETLLSSDTLPLKNPNDDSIAGPSSQASAGQRSQITSPQKGQTQAGQASGLKQTDIGVFFGLEPLKEKEKVAESGSNELNTTPVPVVGEKSGQRRERQRKSRTPKTTDTSQGAAAGESSSVGNARGNAGRGRTRGWRGGRWNRRNADGEVELPHCPFYKKIPGTKFVIDAFQYGEIQGITTYFLTHFHSDHYGGLTKKSKLPIYCNSITGNLVKSKLKVAEQYVHILPMNTQVTVEGTTVTLLEANQ
ncbi:DNA cross-link repair 1A protein [Liparis tanakae]|uniref:DNA cross-link repair 1A protein n=1 Tax=Liparis tanakae TaxID=230148 RepID=A0A4Z2HPC6_9TELE|nr:DNA cross-link repair 1A protein [Liparis tanakae]